MINMDKLYKLVKKQYSNISNLQISSNIKSKEQVLKQFNDKYGIYLFAGHSYANSQNITESFIEIAAHNPDDNTYQKFKFTLPDVYNIRWNHADLIFLLGCETAGGSLYRGIGISGLQTSFLLSGADNVLASLWRIDAAQSIQQASDFLTEYRISYDAIRSLRYAQIRAIDRLKSNSYFGHPYPYFWGSYMLQQKYVINN